MDIGLPSCSSASESLAYGQSALTLNVGTLDCAFLTDSRLGWAVSVFVECS
jgi:hypothetical protein